MRFPRCGIFGGVANGERSVVTLACLLLLAIPIISTAADLQGVVTDHGGKPVPGAKVLLPTAGVRKGTSPLCPSCYPDCAKSATTDAEGKFLIQGLDEELIFNVLVAAPGYQAAYARGTDPRKGEVRVKLKKPSEKGKVFRGKVVDPEGRPVLGAIIETAWHETAELISFSGFPGDGMSVSDRDGTFAIACTAPEVKAIAVEIRAPQLSPKQFRFPSPPSDTIADCQLNRGVMDRDAMTFLGVQTIGTDKDGRFELTNVPAGELWSLWGNRDTLPENSVTATSSVVTGKPDTIQDIGDIEAEDGVVVEGLVRLEDGEKIPANTKIMLEHSQNWDPQMRTLDKEGRFRFAARAGDELSFYVQVPGYTAETGGGSPIRQVPKLNVTPESKTLEIILQREGKNRPGTPAFTGQVAKPDGQPAAKARVLLATPDDILVIENGKVDERFYRSDSGADALETDSAGKFVFPRNRLRTPPDKSHLVILHESGWAMVPPAEHAEVKLTPWVQITGNVRRGTESLPDQMVKGTFVAPGDRIFFNVSAKTNEHGEYVIDRAVPDTGFVGVSNEMRSGRDVYLQRRDIDLRSGKPVRIDLGGHGSDVQGRLIIPGDAAAQIDFGNARGHLASQEQPATEEALPQRQTYDFGLQPDGSFEVHDVSPGNYTISIDLPAPAPENAGVIRERAGLGYGMVRVAVEDREVEAKDLTFSPLKASLKEGEPVPEFSGTSDSGGTISAKTLSGRSAIVVFTIEDYEEPMIKTLAAIPEKDRPLLIIARQQKGKLPEIAGVEYLTGNEVTEMEKAFGVQWWPHIYGLSPQGIILARGQGHEAQEVLNKVLDATQE
jgi:hypothetical protein